MPKLAETKYCTGCTACASACPKGCITMEADENGFRFPAVDTDACVSCGLCEGACPVISPRKLPETGPQAYAAYSRDEALRLDSSSGGIFTELARAVLAENGAVFGAAYNGQFEVTHICAETEAELARLRGAKYAQSRLGDTFADVKRRLEQRQHVLFSGTPCQVAGLKAFLQKDYVNLTAVDFVCHSVPSPMAWTEYVKYRAQQDNNGEPPALINLRSKKTGWSRYQYTNLFTYADGHSHTATSGESLYMKLFVGGYINRECCENCRFKGCSRVSDLTVGDFWGIWDISPEMDDNKGTSVVLVQSPRGADLFNRIACRLVLQPVTLEEASRQNAAMLTACVSNPRRREALWLIRTGNLAACESWFRQPKLPLAQQIRMLARRLLGRP